MKHGSLFSGIGGFDLVAKWMGWENVFHCECMPFPRKVLNYHFPNSISYDDITKTDFTIHRGGIDILTGGFPCQPFSSAGKRLGKEDERHIWPEMLRAIQEIESTYIVGENVCGITNWNGGVVFEEVCADLENCGYEMQPILLPACAVGAPHRRDRVWFVATNTKNIRQKYAMEDGELERRQFRKSYQRNVWDTFPSQSPICGGDDGLPTELDGITFSKWRQESLKGYGNAIVPQVAYQIFKVINHLNKIQNEKCKN